MAIRVLLNRPIRAADQVCRYELELKHILGFTGRPIMLRKMEWNATYINMTDFGMDEVR